MQSECTYQKFCAPAWLALTLHVCHARVQLNRTLAHLLQPSQGLLNELGTVQNTQCGYTYRKSHIDIL